jgi:proteic killer suppression protein
MIISFADKTTEKIFYLGKTSRIQPDILARTIRKLTLIDSAVKFEDLMTPPGNRLHALEDDRSGQYSISVNDQWRICFRFIDGDAYDVEFCDYR